MGCFTLSKKEKKICFTFGMIFVAVGMFGCEGITAKNIETVIELPIAEAQNTNEIQKIKQKESKDKSSNKNEDIKASEENETVVQEQQFSDAWKKKYSKIEKYYVEADYLNQNAQYYIGKTVITVIKAENIKADCFKDGTILVNYEVRVADTNDLGLITKDDEVAIIGKVKEISKIVKAVIIEDAYILSNVDNSEVVNKIKKNEKKQVKYVKKAKKKEKKKAKKKAKKEKEDYINSCDWIDYETVLRNQNRMRGVHCYLVGTILRIFEGTLDVNRVRIVIEDGNGDLWSISYKYSKNEPHFLNDDCIQVWGDYDGTEQYEDQYGNRITLSSIRAKYIEFSGN